MYKVYQIKLSNEEMALINETGDHAAVPKNELKQKMAFAMGNIESYACEALAAGYFTHVANIEANNLDHVFEIGNIGPESNITRISPMHSISVGDVVVADDGTVNVVGDYGFAKAKFDFVQINSK